MAYNPEVPIKNPDGTTASSLNVGGVAKMTATALGANASWNTGWIPYLQYQSATTVIYSDVVSAAAGLKYEYSANGTDVIDTASTTFTNVNEFRFAAFPLGKGNFVRVTFTNGPTPQTQFFFNIILHTDIIESMGSTFTLINAANIAAISKA